MESNQVRIEELLAHAGWVKKLALRLVRDATAADDVAQEVWARALRSPPRDRGNLRGWLATTVRNTVRTTKRARARRIDHEAKVERESESPSAADLVERAQLHQHLVEQVIALDDSHRSVLLAYWFEGQSLVEIAKSRGLTARVVKLRLDAGLVLLRQRMDRASGGRAAWCVAFTDWVGPSHVAAGAAITIGGIVVTSKVVFTAAAVIVTCALGWLLRPTHGSSQLAVGAARDVEVRALDPIVETEGLVLEPQIGAREPSSLAIEQSPSAVANATTTRWVVRGRVRGTPAGREAETKLTAQFSGRSSIQDTAVAQADADGNYELDLTDLVAVWLRNAEPAELVVVADHPVCLEQELRTPFAAARVEKSAATECREYRNDFTLESAAVVTGRVAFPSNWKPATEEAREAHEARVSLFDLEDTAASTNQGLDHALCDAGGRWTLRAKGGGPFVVIAHADGWPPATIAANLTLGRSIDVGTVELQRGLSISGTVHRGGRPIGAGAVVVGEFKSDTRTGLSVIGKWNIANYLRPSQGTFALQQVRTLTGSDGSYSLDGLAAGEYELYVASIPDFRLALGTTRRVERTATAPQTGIDLVDVPPTIELALSVNGRAPTDADLERVIIDLVPSSKDSSGVQIDLTRSATGYGKIQLVAGEAYELRVLQGRYAAESVAISPLEMGEELTIPFKLNTRDQAATILVRFMTTEAHSPSAAQFALQESSSPIGQRLDWRRIERSPDGVFVLDNCGSGRWRVHVRPFEGVGIGASDFHLASAFEIDVAPRATVVHELRLEMGGRLRVSARNELGGFVRAPVQLRNERGETIPTEFYSRVANQGAAGCGWYLCELGPNDHPPLPVGHYELTLSAPDFSPQVVPFDIVNGETTQLDVVLQLR